MVMKLENNDYCAYRKAIEKWGCTSIQLKAIEELNELSIEIIKSMNGTGDYHKIIEELVDVVIMCEQVYVIYDEGVFNAVWNEKIQRFKNRLNRVE